VSAPAPISHRQAVGDFARALRYVAPLKGLFAGKIAYMIAGFVPAVVLPWPVKVLIDHVIQGMPLDETRYPFFLQPLVDALEGLGPAGIAVAVVLFSGGMLVVFGGWGDDESRDSTSAELGEGSDTATRSENDANFAFSFMGGLLGWLEYRLHLRLSQRLNHHYRSALFERIQRLPMAHLDDQRIGDAIYRLMYDTPQITEVCTRLVLTPAIAPLQIGVTVWVMSLTFGDAPIVLWAAAGLVPVTLLVTLPFTNATRRRALQARASGAVATTTIEEGLSNVLAVQSLGGSARERQRFEDDSWASYDESRRYLWLWIVVGFVAGTAGIAVAVGVFYALSDRVFAGEMSLGDLGVILSFYGQLSFLGDQVSRLWIYLQDNAAGLRRVFELMDRPGDPQPADAVPLPELREGFRLEGVSVRYPDGTEALRGVDLEARRGRMLALCGPAGSGKTTLAYLFPRFLSPSSGRITVDGVDLAAVDRDDLRRRIAFVFQEPALFDATVAENIRIGKPDASDTELRRAAEQAGADEFIERLPRGYDTPLGRGGGRLSMGQKQRLAIARALVRDAPVLVLDEPTSALDPETEMRLVASLREASRDRLVIVIAHRLSTIRSADEIAFLDEGRVRERGSHAELMARPDGAYRRFVELQAADAA